jgi:hypothetical protein
MPIADDLRAIAERTNRDLDAVHDFFEHSKIVWRSFQILVDKGHTVSSDNSSLAEIKATRDILEHNAGVVNDIYLRKAGKKARYANGDHVEIDDTYHLGSLRLLKKVVADLTAAGVARLAKQ